MALVGKNGHESVLEEDSSFYQVQEKKPEKQKWKELTPSQRMHYFIDYYLMKCILIIIILAILSFVIWSIARPKNERMLFLAVVENSLVPEEKESLERKLSEMFITGKNQEVYIDDMFPVSYESDAKLSAYLSAHEIDLIITNEKRFQTLANNGCFEDLNSILPELSDQYADSLYWAQKEDDSSEESDTIPDSLSAEDKNENKLHAYGIEITNCESFKDSWFAEDKAIIGIVVNCPHPENAKRTLIELFF